MKGRWQILAMGVIGFWPTHAPAQLPFNNNSEAQEAAPVQVGGSTTVDLISLTGANPGVPLRFGGVVPNSERVEFNGKTLVKGRDYQMDYESGVVYLMRAAKAGERLMVTYRYTGQTKAPEGKSLAAFKFDLVPGGMKMLMGYGMTERTADGNVLSSNVYGWSNGLKFGSSQIKGALLYADRANVQSQSGFEYRATPGQVEKGHSRLVLQNLQTGFMGGTLEAGYQEISKNFTAFGALQDSGYSAQDIQNLTKERGLERWSLGFKGVNVGGMKLSSGTQTVGDSSGNITWRNFQISQNGFSLDWNARQIDKGFSRIKDLREQDREQMFKEAGMARENLTAGLKGKWGALSYQNNDIDDGVGKSISRNLVSLDSTKFKFELGKQEVDGGFARMASLVDSERATYGRELGMKRQWSSVETSLFGTAVGSISFKELAIKTPTGNFESQDYHMGNSLWSLDHTKRGTGAQSNALSAMAEPELDANIKAVASMVDPTANLFRPEERGWFMRGVGVNRESTRFTAKPFKNWNFDFRSMKVDNAGGDASVDALHIAGRDINFRFRQQKMADTFGDMMNLMDFERKNFGGVSGLDRTDMALDAKLGKNKGFQFNRSQADLGQNGFSRDTFAYKDPRLAVTVNQRSVDSGFDAVARILDPEKDFLNQIRGFKQRDVKVDWSILPNLKLDALIFDAQNDVTGEQRMLRDTKLSWTPDKNTQMSLIRVSRENDNPLAVLFANSIEQISLQKNFGRLGQFKYLSERQEFDGQNNQQADSLKRYLAYETKLNAKTSVRTEQTNLRYDNGEHEDTNANTVSTEISKRAGVSVTDVSVDRSGEKRDERKRNYGFWLDFGNGMRLSYGYARQLVGDLDGTGLMQSQLQLTPGQVGWFQVGQGQYNVNQWDGSRTQATSNVNFGTAKPMNVGILRDVKFQFGMDTAADRGNWLKENRQIAFSGRWGSNLFGYEYRSQMAPGELRGIDRVFTFETDRSDKRWLQGGLFYKVRTLPDNKQIMVRKFDLTLKPNRHTSLTHQMLTNPEVARGDALLGSITQGAQVNRWKLDFNRKDDMTIGGSWEEIMDTNRPRTRTAGLNVTLFKKSGSPLSLYYGLEENDAGGNRSRADRYHIRFDQKAGPNQVFSFFAGNVSYNRTQASGTGKHNWTLRLDYQLRL